MYAFATGMGLQHTCDVPPSVKAWMVLCMEYLQQIQKRSGCMLISSVEVFMLNAICRLSVKCSAIIAGCLLVFQYAFLKALSTHSAVLGHLLDVVIHSCNYIHLHLVQQPCRLFMKNDCLVWDDRKLVTTLCVIIQTATSLLVIAILSLPSGLVHEVPSTEFSNHPSIMIAAWRYVV